MVIKASILRFLMIAAGERRKQLRRHVGGAGVFIVES